MYPAVEPLIKAHGVATATMETDHRAIERHIQSLEDAATRLESGRKTGRAEARRDLTRLVWQLQALVEVHLEKEEQVYLPLVEQFMPEAEQRSILRRCTKPRPSGWPNAKRPVSMSGRCLLPVATPSSWKLPRHFARSGLHARERSRSQAHLLSVPGGAIGEVHVDVS